MSRTALLPDVLTAVLFAELLECTPETVEEATRTGKLPGVKYGRSWVYPREAVLQVLTTQALANVRATASDAAQDKRAASVTPLHVARPAASSRRGRQRRSPAPLSDPPGAV